jgi:hypothetical protein
VVSGSRDGNYLSQDLTLHTGTIAMAEPLQSAEAGDTARQHGVGARYHRRFERSNAIERLERFERSHHNEERSERNVAVSSNHEKKTVCRGIHLSCFHCESNLGLMDASGHF